MHIETQAIHEGVMIDSEYQSVTTPIYQTSTFYSKTLEQKTQFDYTRSGNPTRKSLENNLAKLENGVASSATATGMAAITAALTLLDSGDHLITSCNIYGGTYRLFSNAHKKFGIEVSFIDDLNDLEALEKHLKPNTKMLWLETPSNPLLQIINIKKLVAFAKAKNPQILVAVDNTFMSPYFQKPLDLGCDLVMHSTTKYINGHSDIVGGIVITKEAELGKKVAYLVNCLGLACSPFEAWLVLRGVKTLPHRMKAHQYNALQIAKFLESHPLVQKVFYPGLPSHPQFDLIQKQMLGYGGMVSFSLNLQKADLNKFFANLKLFPLAVSLGGVESLIAQPWSMSHASMSEEARTNAGIDPSIVRISAGIEHSDDLIADLDQALCCCC
jgi:cystathionine gamma-synthase